MQTFSFKQSLHLFVPLTEQKIRDYFEMPSQEQISKICRVKKRAMSHPAPAILDVNR